MLSKDDKKWIQEQLKGRNQGRSTTIPVIDNYQGNARLAELSGKIGKGKESISERMEYERLKFQNQLEKKIDATIPRVIQKSLGRATEGLSKGIDNLINKLAKNKLDKNFNTNLVLSEKSKFLKNDSNKLINLKTESKSENKLQTQSFVLNSSGSCQNYVLAKEAIFNGGDSTIYNIHEEKKQGVFDGLRDVLNFGQTKKEKEEVKKHNMFVQNILGGVHKYAKNIMDSLNVIKTFEILKWGLISVALLKGVDMLIGLYKKFIGNVPSQGNVVDAKQQSNNFKEQANMSTDDYNDKLNKATDSAITDKKAMKKIVSAKDSDNLFTKLSKGAYNTAMKESKGEFGNSGWSLQSKEDSIYRAPFDMKIIRWEENNRKEGIVNIIAERIVQWGINKNVELMNVKNPLKFPNEIVKKGEPIGFVGPTGKIDIKDINEQEADDYIKMINDYTKSDKKEDVKVSDERRKKLNEYMTQLSKTSSVRDNSGNQQGYTDNVWSGTADESINQHVRNINNMDKEIESLEKSNEKMVRVPDARGMLVTVNREKYLDSLKKKKADYMSKHDLGQNEYVQQALDNTKKANPNASSDSSKIEEGSKTMIVNKSENQKQSTTIQPTNINKDAMSDSYDIKR